MGDDRGLEHVGEDVGRQGLGLGGGDAAERASVTGLRRRGGQLVFGDLLLGHRQALEDDLRPGCVHGSERGDVLGQRGEQVDPARVPVGDDEHPHRAVSVSSRTHSRSPFRRQPVESAARPDRHTVRVGDGDELGNHPGCLADDLEAHRLAGLPVQPVLQRRPAQPGPEAVGPLVGDGLGADLGVVAQRFPRDTARAAGHPRSSTVCL
ncbi:hypothetical protein AMK17_38165 [Streptomyces sp. CB00072]|nr:hypothetical protein AMK17_38165 [Streptomyces sp. CB00072]